MSAARPVLALVSLALVAFASCREHGAAVGLSAPAPSARAILATPSHTDSSKLRAVPFDQVEITDAFWKPRIETNRSVTVKACLDQCEATGRIANFRRCGKLEEGEHQGLLYNDSDVYKVLEGVAYTLKVAPDQELEARADLVIEAIAAAQQPDGYLDTYWTMVKPAERWTDIAHGHEMYCAGHLIEAAIAYAHATGKRKLLEVAVRLADHIDGTFGPGKKLDPCGHPEIELALVKLWRETGEPRYLELAEFFLDQRGNPARAKLFGEYAQDHQPVREQRAIVGHAVRAMYLYCAMADVAGVTGDAKLWEALDALWKDVVETKMYVTGGIGSSAANEGITVPFDLPNDTAYCETCASIGMALWNQRMFLATGDAKYADVVERELYNGVLAGISLSGDRFFYDNPLASRGGHQRVPWFDCSCCPTNLVRFLPSIGDYVYAVGERELYIAQYVSSRTVVEIGGKRVQVEVQRADPFTTQLEIAITVDEPVGFALKLRGLRRAHSSSINARGPDASGGGSNSNASHWSAVMEAAPVSASWETLKPPGSSVWQPGTTRFKVTFQRPPVRVYADQRIAADVGRVALQYGPFVYCAEAIDNGGYARNLALPREAEIRAVPETSELGSIVYLAARGEARRPSRVATRSEDDPLPRLRDAVVLDAPQPWIRLVPYYAWANRAPGEMVVWLPETLALAEMPGQGEVIEQNGAKISASHCWRGDTLLALNDGVLPKSSGDGSIPRHTFWDHRGTKEWLQYEFAELRSASRARIYWFDDTGAGSCRVPVAWRLLYRAGEEWKPVDLAPGASYGVARDAEQSVEFESVNSAAYRVEVELQPGLSAGVLEWSLE